MRTPILGAALTIAALTFGSAFAQPIIVESGAEGQNHPGYSEIRGRWVDSLSKSTVPQLTPGIMTRYADIYEGIPSVARFTPILPQSGNYEIQVVWPASANANKVKYVIHHARGEDVKYLDQDGWGAHGSSNANRWQTLGVYEFKEGSNGWVDVSDEDIAGTP
ncbi:MAG: hypothetical protein V2A74_00005, partial [bacterium]